MAGIGMTEPLFVVGVTRSGTTLLTRMLDSHPNISIYSESHFLCLVWTKQKNDALPTGDDLQLALDRTLGLQDEGLLQAEIRERLPKTNSDLRSLFDTILKLRMEQNDKRRYGEKTPNNFCHLNVLLSWYPKAKVIFIFRDPRNTHSSFKHSPVYGELSFVFRNSITRSLYWNFCHRIMVGAKRVRSNQVANIRFEDLIDDPEKVIRSICTFLGEDFDDQVMRVDSNNSSFDKTRAKYGIRKEVLIRNQYLSKREVALIEMLCGKCMRENGYELSVIPSRVIKVLSMLRFYELVDVAYVVARRMAHLRTIRRPWSPFPAAVADDLREPIN